MNLRPYQHIERKLKQVVLADLVTPQFGALYKLHLEAMRSWLKILSAELSLEAQMVAMLDAAIFGLHWGCVYVNHGLVAVHHNAIEHTSKCYQLSAGKIERFLSFHDSKQFSSSQLITIAKIIEEQVEPNLISSPLAQLLFEISTIAWGELFQDGAFNELFGQKQSLKSIINRDYFVNKQQLFKNEPSRQAMVCLLAEEAQLK
jgi:hypothetical protein